MKGGVGIAQNMKKETTRGQCWTASINDAQALDVSLDIGIDNERDGEIIIVTYWRVYTCFSHNKS